MLLKKKTWSIITVLLVMEALSYHNNLYWKESVLTFFIPLPLLLIIFLSLNKNTALQKQAEDAEIYSTKLEKKMLELKVEAKNYQNRQMELNHLFNEFHVFLFTFNIKENTWFMSDTFQEYEESGMEDFQKGIEILENMIHPDDIDSFLKRKEAWLSGIPSTVEFRTVEKDKSIRWNELRTSLVTNSSGEAEIILGIVTEITQHKENEEKLEQMAFFDKLTDLANRTMLESHLKKAILRAKRKEHEVAIMFIDLDGFKEVNDTYGHDVGDALLKEVAARLKESVREEDFISRLGGDEFLIVFEETAKEEIALIAERMLINVSEPYLMDDNSISITPSIGISSYPEDGETLELVITNADKAMYFAKSNGKSNYQFYSPNLEDYQPKETLMNKLLKWFQK